MARKYGWWMSALALSLAWVFAPQAGAKSTLSCTIVDEGGKPVGKQEFILSSSGGKQSKKKTNDQGEVKFTGLDDGSYSLGSEGSVPGTFQVSGNAEIPCKYTALSATTANAKLQEVAQLLQQRKFADAEEKAKKNVEVMPGLGESHYYLAAVYAAQGKLDEGMAEIQKAAELNPDKFKDKVTNIQLMGLDAQAKQAENKRDFDGAIKKYEAMLTVAPNSPTPYYSMAVAYGNAGKFDQALKSIDKAIAIKPDDAESQQLKIRLQDLYLKQMDKKLEK